MTTTQPRVFRTIYQVRSMGGERSYGQSAPVFTCSSSSGFRCHTIEIVIVVVIFRFRIYKQIEIEYDMSGLQYWPNHTWDCDCGFSSFHMEELYVCADLLLSLVWVLSSSELGQKEIKKICIRDLRVSIIQNNIWLS